MTLNELIEELQQYADEGYGDTPVFMFDGERQSDVEISEATTDGGLGLGHTPAVVLR